LHLSRKILYFLGPVCIDHFKSEDSFSDLALGNNRVENLKKEKVKFKIEFMPVNVKKPY
jgi:hypothetical protein